MIAREFVVLVSSDEHEYVLSRKVVEHCQKLKQLLRITETERRDLNTPLTLNLTIKGENLEILCQYLHYKNRWYTQDLSKIPKFEIPGDKALEVLKAAIELNL